MGFWERYASTRLTRRRSLAATGSLASAAALLAACGGGSDSEEAASSGQLAPITDSSSKAVRGGILPSYSGNDTSGFTVYPALISQINGHNDRAYSKLLKGTYANRSKGERPLSTVEGDLAESFEMSGDGLQLTLRIRQNAGLDPRPPTNGRMMNIEDVKFAWDKYAALHRSRGQLLNSVSANAPVESVTYPDSRTMVFKLAFTSPSLLVTLANFANGPFMYPVEADGRYDPAKDMRGSGPWMLDKYEPSVLFQYRRNPNYYLKERPYLDGIDMPIISETASVLSQFKAGRIYAYNPTATDLLQTKADVPDLELRPLDFGFNLSFTSWFDFRPGSGTIWRDDRVRHALSMSMDRITFLETLNNTEQFERAGLAIEKRLNSHLSQGEAEFWLDPTNEKEFGASAKYFQYNIPEATKLIQAATGKAKADSAWTVITGNEFGAAYTQQEGVLMQMYNEGPFNFHRVGVDYNQVFIRFISAAPRLTGGHEFDGATLGQIAAFPEIDSYFSNHFIPGGAFYKFEEDYPGPNDRWHTLLKQQKVELDRTRRANIIKDWQRYAAERMLFVPHPGQTSTFGLSWPWAGNAGTFSSRNGNQEVHLWIDQTKKKA